ncbi:hypothetical protein [Microbacterium sp. SORGH_AS_0888]|uniref:hypothetical protein n=1 Tax=Microbacterium sp. SORGH_AS_0888 TaxID=3041791 RepID=UPI00278267ED|nr:hypothetical protein [Microbacterium sp. SORGH_AS_0888]MDQ1130201.1 hypothetical protein [Microbacterium sp. SORGH_AS_0888]
MDSFWVAALWAVLPTACLVVLFFFILRSVVHMDRNERRAYAKAEAEERARRGMPPAGAAASER